jgi:hypothetical protein
VHNIARDVPAREAILEALLGYHPRRWRTVASVITSKPAIYDHFKTGQRSR